MSIVTGALERARLKYPDIDLENIRVIGWGAGQFFRDYYPHIRDQLRLEYTICPLPENQGKNVHGVDIRPPAALENESSDNTLIVVMAIHHPEIMNQISQAHGGFRTIQAISFDEGNIALIDEIQDLEKMLPGLSLQRRLPSPARTGIFVQGVVQAHTPLVLAWNRQHFPASYQCMVTWDHQPPALLDRCRPWLDQLILVPQPENLGLFHRNVILRSARLGVEHLAEQNIEYAVRCRSDNILSGSVHEAIAALFSRGRNRGRIAVSLGASWQHIPFHFSEKAMLGRTGDMLRLCSQPEDPRPASWADDELSPLIEMSPQRHFQELHQYTAESYWWKSYARQLGYPTETLADGYRFAKERLLALEPHLGWFSLKFSPLFNVAMDNGYSFSPESWNRLFSDSDDALQRAEAVSRLALNSRDYWQRKAG